MTTTPSLDNTKPLPTISPSAVFAEKRTTDGSISSINSGSERSRGPSVSAAFAGAGAAGSWGLLSGSATGFFVFLDEDARDLVLLGAALGSGEIVVGFFAGCDSAPVASGDEIELATADVGSGVVRFGAAVTGGLTFALPAIEFAPD